MSETETARNKLRDLAEARLSLYIREMGEEFFADLICCKPNWRAGYLPVQGCFAVFPQTDRGHVIVGPFTVVKWTWGELEALGVASAGLVALTDEARGAGFEQWAAAAPCPGVERPAETVDDGVAVLVQPVDWYREVNVEGDGVPPCPNTPDGKHQISITGTWCTVCGLRGRVRVPGC